MNKFAKLFEFEDIGQVLVFLDTSVDEGEITVTMDGSQVAGGLGVATVETKYSGKKQKASRKFFDDYTEEMAREHCQKRLDELKILIDESDELEV